MDVPTITVRKTIFYLLGMTLIAFGIVILLRSDLGNSAWDTFHYSISQALGVTMGWANFIVAGSATLVVSYVHKKWRYLLIVIPIVSVSLLIDLFNLHIILNNYNPTGITAYLAFLVGVVIVPYGASLLVLSTYPAGVYEELMLVIMKALNTEKIALVRISMEIIVVALALIIGFSIGIGFGVVNWGTIFISFTLGPILQYSLKVNKPLFK
jgi:uncharacterized membrane protein YczE